MAIRSFRGKYHFLSNFYEKPILYKGLWFGSSEAAYQAMKRPDPEDWKAFCDLPPGQAKKLGQFPPLRDGWNDLSPCGVPLKVEVMASVVDVKFNDPELAELLLATGEEELVEENSWHDLSFGVCNGRCRYGPHSPRGENWLGVCLMVKREMLKEKRCVK